DSLRIAEGSGGHGGVGRSGILKKEIFPRGPDAMLSPATPIPPRVEYHRSRQLIAGARRRIASAKALMAHSRQSLARQRFLTVVCAWCQRPMGWERCDESDYGQVSHGICDDCSVRMFPVLQTRPPPPLYLPQAPESYK